MSEGDEEKIRGWIPKGGWRARIEERRRPDGSLEPLPEEETTKPPAPGGSVDSPSEQEPLQRELGAPQDVVNEVSPSKSPPEDVDPQKGVQAPQEETSSTHLKRRSSLRPREPRLGVTRVCITAQ